MVTTLQDPGFVRYLEKGPQPASWPHPMFPDVALAVGWSTSVLWRLRARVCCAVSV